MMAGPTAGSEDHAGVENSGASASAVPHGSTPSQAAGPDPAQPSTISAPVRPQGWDQIGIGSVVLATVGVEDGWWEAVVLGVNGGACTLKWRDFPRERTFVRRRTELALLPPPQAEADNTLGWQSAQVPCSMGGSPCTTSLT